MGSSSLELRNLQALGLHSFEEIVHRPPKGNYCSAVTVFPVVDGSTSGLVHLAGHIPYQADGSILKGRISTHLDHEKGLFSLAEGYEIARNIGLSLIRSLYEELDGQLDRVRRVVKINGLVRAAEEDFGEHPAVINGASDVLITIFGEERGKHARCAYGVHSLPFQAPIEIDMLVEIGPNAKVS